MPITNTLSTTPTMICWARYLIAKTASTTESKAAVNTAETSPMIWLSVMLETTAAINAPVSSCPSIAMLTTPTRSAITPPMAPRMMGTANTSACPTMNATGTVLSAASQPSRAITPSSPYPTFSQSDGLRLRVASQKPIAAMSTNPEPSTVPSALEEKTMSAT